MASYIINSSLKSMRSIFHNVRYYSHISISKSNLLTNNRLPIDMLSCRSLFAVDLLGVDRYVAVRDKVSAQFGDMKESFFPRMTEYVNKEGNIVFTEDLKNALYLVDDNEAQLEIVHTMLHKFHSQSGSLRFGTFVFGPIVMRMIYHLGKPDLAIQLFKDEKLKGFFNQVTTLTLVLDLLYENERYQDVLDVFDHAKENMTLETKYPRDSILLVMAACYKLNCRESYDYALETLKAVRQVGAQVTRKAVTMFAALALSQNEPNMAIEILSLATQTNYVTVRNLRLMALSDLGRFQDIFTTIKLFLNQDVPAQKNFEPILSETLEYIRVKVNKTDDKALIHEFSQIERALTEGNFIQTSSMDSVLSLPVKAIPIDQRNQRNLAGNNMRQSYQHQSNRGGNWDNYNSRNNYSRDNYNDNNYRENDRDRGDQYRDRGDQYRDRNGPPMRRQRQGIRDTE